MPEGDDTWEWWEILDIFTGVDERLARIEDLLEEQNSMMKGLNGSGGGGTMPSGSGGIIENTPITNFPVDAVSFNREITGENVELDPGKSEVIVEADVGSGKSIIWYDAGNNDATYTEYQYLRDGVEIFNEPLTEPLGLYNNPYVFPQPLTANRTVSIKANRTDDAPGSEEYYGKVSYVEINDEKLDSIRNAWRSM